MTAEELLKWRKRLRLSQQAAADLLGCSRRGLQQWEKGESPVPKTIALAVAAVSFDLPPYGKKK